MVDVQNGMCYYFPASATADDDDVFELTSQKRDRENIVDAGLRSLSLANGSSLRGFVGHCAAVVGLMRVRTFSCHSN